MISKKSIIALKLVYLVIWGMQSVSKILGYILLLILHFRKRLLVLILIGKTDFNVATTSIIFK